LAQDRGPIAGDRPSEESQVVLFSYRRLSNPAPRATAAAKKTPSSATWDMTAMKRVMDPPKQTHCPPATPRPCPAIPVGGWQPSPSTHSRGTLWFIC